MEDMEEFRGVRTVSFDFGGTLAYEVYPRGMEHMVYWRVFRKLGYEFEAEEVKSAFSEAVSWWRELKCKTGAVWSESALSELITRMLRRLGVEASRGTVESAIEARRSMRLMKAYEDAKPALEALKSMGLNLIVVSNVSSERNLDTYLTQVGLREYFSLLVASGSLGVEKPDPRIFLYASKASNTPPGMIVHVGDDYRADYLGAEGAGLKAILLDREGVYKELNCRRVKTLLEIPRLLRNSCRIADIL